MAGSAGFAFVDLLPRVNPAAFSAAANAQIRPAMQALSSKVATGAKGLAAAIGTPLAISAGAGVVAVVGRMTLEFEDAFTRIAAISNASAAQIGRWREAVFSLGRETAVAPQKLADGLFYLASAGLDANQIFPALEASAKAAAIGLGEMGDIARLVANVLNAYPQAGLKAADAVDVLVAAVREGTAEPNEFADAMGRLLPIAGKAGVSFDELAASLSVLSNIGLDVDEGVTGVRQVLNLIVSPGKQAADTMHELGLSAEQLRNILRDGGIIPVLETIEKAVGGNEEQFRKLLPNIRAMTAAFGLTEQEATKVEAIFREVANSTGDMDKAFQETQEGQGFRFRQLMERLTEVAIRLGQVLLPIARGIAAAFIAIFGPISDVLALLAKAPAVLIAVGTAFAAWAALKFLPGLLFSIAKGLVSLGVAKNIAVDLAFLSEALKALATKWLPLIGSALKAAGPLTLVPAAFFAIGSQRGRDTIKTIENMRRQIRLFGRDSIQGVHAQRELAQAMGLGFQRVPRTAEETARLRQEFLLLVDQEDKASRAQEILNTSLDDFQKKTNEAVPGLQAAARGVAELTGQSFAKFSENAKKALAASQDNTKAWSDFTVKVIDKAAEAFSDFKDQAFENLNFVAGALGDLSSAATSAQEELAAGTDATGEALTQLRRDALLTPEELLKAFRAAAQETKDFGRDLLEITKRGGEGGKRLAEVLLGMGDAGKAAAQTIADAPRAMQQRLIEAFGAGEGAAETLATKLTRLIVGTLDDIRTILQQIAEAWGVEIQLDGDEEVETKLDGIQHRLDEFNGKTYEATLVATTIFRRKGPGPAGDAGGFDPRQDGVAEGGIIPAQRGMVVRRPTVLAGEGKYATPMGTGAEAVLPLNDEVMGRLGAAIAGAMGAQTIVVKVGEEELARAVTRGQRRRRQLVGA